MVSVIPFLLAVLSFCRRYVSEKRVFFISPLPKTPFCGRRSVLVPSQSRSSFLFPCASSLFFLFSLYFRLNTDFSSFVPTLEASCPSSTRAELTDLPGLSLILPSFFRSFDPFLASLHGSFSICCFAFGFKGFLGSPDPPPSVVRTSLPQ